MIRKKILVLASYPIANPQHGGQKRVKAIVNFYKSIFFEVKFVAVFHRSFYQEYSDDDILLGQADVIKKLDNNPYAAELIAGKAIDNDIHVRSRMAKVLMEFKPDIIHVEQIYLYLGLSVLLKELNTRSIIILSSQTIEHKMKKEIFKGLNLQKKEANKIYKETENLERKFSKEADIVISVTEEEATAHIEMGASKTIVAPNGIESVTPTAKAKLYWKKFKKDHNINAVITFIGSGHPPNWVGFIDMVGTDTSFIPGGSKILLAGGISEYFKTTFKYSLKSKGKLWANALPVGFLSEDILAGLICESEVILLPITSGGGSNLKTAEAILSGKKIVATSYAFRGFERYIDLPNIYIADDKTEFKKLIIKAIESPYIERSAKQIRLAKQVQWQYCLLPIKKELKKIIRPKVKAQVSGGYRKIKSRVGRTIRMLKASAQK